MISLRAGQSSHGARLSFSAVPFLPVVLDMAKPYELELEEAKGEGRHGAMADG